MREIMDWMIAEGIAKNDFQASAIVNGLKLWELPSNPERRARVVLYRKWRPLTETKKSKRAELPAWQAFELAIAGIDPDHVTERQIGIIGV